MVWFWPNVGESYPTSDAHLLKSVIGVSLDQKISAVDIKQLRFDYYFYIMYITPIFSQKNMNLSV